MTLCQSLPLGEGKKRNLKLDDSCSSKSRVEIENRTVQFSISTLDFELQESSNFKFLFLPSPSGSDWQRVISHVDVQLSFERVYTPSRKRSLLLNKCRLFGH